jgi:polyisoprenoid-binding protein YceI
VAVAAGEHEIGPGTGRLVVRTYREGAAARVGHDLVIEASGWRGRVTVRADPGAAPAASVEVELGGLAVVEGTGGVKPLSDGDKRQIRQTMHKVLRLDRHARAVFTTRRVEPVGPHGDSAVVLGDLDLAGQTHPLRVEVRRQDDLTVVGKASFAQSEWGIKPYSGFFGALKVRDTVDIECTVALPRG